MFTIQAIYWMVFLIGISKKSTSNVVQSLPPVSIIVCAHDEEQNLRELIPLLLAQDHPDFEIIIVDDRSNDGTGDFLIEETAKKTKIKMVKVTQKPEHIPGKKFALTLGIKSAIHDIVLLTDADCRPTSQSWASTMASYFSDKTDIVIGVSPYQKTGGWLNLLIRFEALLTSIFYSGFTKIGIPYMGVGRNLAYRKKIFFEGKGFNAHLSAIGGDDDLFVNQHARAKNTAIVLDNKSLVLTSPATTFSTFFNQKKRHLAAGKFYKGFHKFLLAPLMITQCLFIPTSLIMLLGFKGILTFTLLLARWIIIGITVRSFNHRTGTEFPLFMIPVADAYFTFYYLATAPAALVSQKIVWKT